MNTHAPQTCSKTSARTSVLIAAVVRRIRNLALGFVFTALVSIRVAIACALIGGGASLQLHGAAAATSDLLWTSAPQVSAASVMAGSNITVSASLKNGGTAMAAATESKAQIKNSSGGQVATATTSTSSLAVGGTTTVSITVALLTTLPPGIYTAYLIADNRSVLTQSNTSNDYSTGTTFTITALANAPSVLTNAASNVTSTSATLNASITNTGGSSIVDSRFEYTDSNFPGTVIYSVPVSGSSFSYTVTGLRPGTAYVVHAYAKNSAGIWNSAVNNVNFTTLPAGDTTAPTVSLFQPSGGTSFTSAQNVVILVNASDNVGVSRVEIYDNGGLLATNYTAPYGTGWPIALASNGTHTLTARAYDAAGNVTISAPVTVTVAIPTTTVDTTPPALTITTPDNQTVATASFTVSGTATDSGTGNNGISSVTVAGASASGGSATGSTTANWTRAVTLIPGTTVLTVTARDNSPAQNATSKTITVIYNAPDTTAPSVALNAPSSGATFTTAQTATLGATAADNVAIARVDFLVDGALQGSATASPYTYAWSITSAINGTHTLSARAYDVANNSTTSAPVTVSVNIPSTPGADSSPPSLSVPTSWNTTNRFFSLSGSATDAGTGDSGIVSVTVNGTAATGGTATGTGVANWNLTLTLSPGNNVVNVTAKDNSPNQNGTTKVVTLTYTPTDTTPPTVAITSPALGTTVVTPLSTTLSASAADDNGIAKVEFYVDGTLVGTDTSMPFSANWPITTAQNGTRNLTAVATDTAGNATTSSPVSVTVNIPTTPAPDTTAPTIAITAPVSGATFVTPLSTTLSASAADDNGIAKVEFYVDGTLIGIDTSTPFSASWPITTAQNGMRRLTAVATDTAGNATTSSPVTVTVNISATPAADTIAPTLTIVTTDHQTITIPTFTVSGAATDSGTGGSGISSVTVDGVAASGGIATGSTTTNWSRTLTLSPGVHALPIVARDDSPTQNATTKTLTVTYTPAATTTQTILTAYDVTGTAGQMVTLTAMLESVNIFGLRDSIGGQTVEFWVEGIRVGSATSTARGVNVSFPFSIPLTPGKSSFSYYARFPGSAVYGPQQSSTRTLTISVGPSPTISFHIIQDFIPEGRNNRPGFFLAPRFVTIHDTDNPAANADAAMHARYVKNPDTGVDSNNHPMPNNAINPSGWHLTVDDHQAYQHLPFTESGWHAGDGASGPGNRQSIGIEICMNKNGNRAQAEENAAWLTAKMLRELKLTRDQVKQHNNWSGKNCPSVLRGRAGGWEDFLARVDFYLALGPTSAPVASRAGTYFGTLGVNAGTFSLYVRADGTGSFLGYVPGANVAFLSRDIALSSSGSFRFGTAGASSSTTVAEGRAAAFAEFVIDASIDTNGALTGSVSGLNLALAGIRSATGGPTQNLSGFYQASAPNTAAAAYAILGADREAYVLTVTPQTLDGGAGSIDPSGALTVNTAGNTRISGTVQAESTILTASVTSPGALPLNYRGASDRRVGSVVLTNSSSRSQTIASNPANTIAGFVITGPRPKQILIRGVGPTLKQFGVAGPLPAAQLKVFRGATLVTSNASWQSVSNASAVVAASVRVGAFPFPAGSRDAALLLTLDPGAYTATLEGVDNASGISLIEIYDATEGTPSADSKLGNMSIRGPVGTGEGVLIVGLCVSGDVPKRVLIRGIGPGLLAFGVPGALADPLLKIYKDGTVIATNDNWGSAPAPSQIVQTTTAVGAFALNPNSKDAALLLSLEPGTYTIQISGAANSTGIALAEIYEVP